MFGQPPHRTAHLGNNAFEPRHRRQRVFDDCEIDPERERCLGEEGETLLYEIVYLPIPAMDKCKRRHLRIGSKKQIEPLARGIAVSEVQMADGNGGLRSHAAPAPDWSDWRRQGPLLH